MERDLQKRNFSQLPYRTGACGLGVGDPNVTLLLLYRLFGLRMNNERAIDQSSPQANMCY